MGIGPSKSSAVTEVPRYPNSGDRPATTAPPHITQVSVANQALPAPAGTAPLLKEGDPAREAIARAVSTELRRETVRRVFTDVMTLHWGLIRAASAANPGRELRVQDVYGLTQAQIDTGRELPREAFRLALGHCQLDKLVRKKGGEKGEKETLLERWLDAGNTPGTQTVRTAGYPLMDPALPAPLRAKLAAALQAYTRLGDPRGVYLGTTKTDIATDRMDDVRKAVTRVAREAHWGEGGYEGLQRVLLDRMMPALLDGIQQRFPGTDLQTAVTELPRFVNDESLEWWQELAVGSAYEDDYRPYDRIEQMTIHYIKLPLLLHMADTPPLTRVANTQTSDHAGAWAEETASGGVGEVLWPLMVELKALTKQIDAISQAGSFDTAAQAQAFLDQKGGLNHVVVEADGKGGYALAIDRELLQATLEALQKEILSGAYPRPPLQ